jgi:hypothetical protein
MIAADRRLDHTLAVLRRREDEPRMARLRVKDKRTRRRRTRGRGLTRVTGDGIANQRAKFLIRDFH